VIDDGSSLSSVTSEPTPKSAAGDRELGVLYGMMGRKYQQSTRLARQRLTTPRRLPCDYLRLMKCYAYITRKPTTRQKGMDVFEYPLHFFPTAAASSRLLCLKFAGAVVDMEFPEDLATFLHSNNLSDVLAVTHLPPLGHFWIEHTTKPGAVAYRLQDREFWPRDSVITEWRICQDPVGKMRFVAIKA
jgi:hypothetical protein